MDPTNTDLSHQKTHTQSLSLNWVEFSFEKYKVKKKKQKLDQKIMLNIKWDWERKWIQDLRNKKWVQKMKKENESTSNDNQIGP